MLTTLLIVAVIAIIAFYIVKEMELPQPARMIVSIIVGAILLSWLFHSAGVPLL